MKNGGKIYSALLFFALLCLVLAGAGFWVFAGIKKDSEDLIFAKNKIAALDAQIKEVQAFQKNYSSYKPDLDRIDRLFVDPENPVDFIEFLEDTAFGLNISSQISLPSFSSGKKQTPIVFQFLSKGSFSDIVNFSKEIESGPYLMEIQNLTIQNSADEKTIPKDYSKRQVSAIFSIKAFIKPR